MQTTPQEIGMYISESRQGQGRNEGEDEVSSVGERSHQDVSDENWNVSELASMQHSQDGGLKPPSCLRCFEALFSVKSPVSGRRLEEATGWAMDASARGPLNQAGAFVGVALVNLATKEAGCEKTNDCDRTVYGLQPGSLLAVISVAVGLFAAFAMPLLGAVVDHTRYRKHVGATTAVVIVCVTGSQIFVNENNWFIMACLEAFGGFALLMHIAAVNAYLPDLSLKEQDYIQYTTAFNLRQYISQSFFVILVVAMSLLYASNQSDSIQRSVGVARRSAALAFVMSLLLLGYSWMYLFRQRPPLRELKEGQSLLTSGIDSVKTTTKRVFSTFPALRFFMLGLMFAPDSGSGTLLSITTSFLTVFLEMSSQQLAVVSVVLLLCNLIGSIISRKVSKLLNPLRSYQLAMASLIFCTALTAIVLNDPSRQFLAYPLAGLWGVMLGWTYPAQRVLFCTLIPRGQEFEFMGIFTFFGQILGWLPSLLFTILNENGVSMQWGLGLIPGFFSVALLFTLLMGDYNEAVAIVTEENYNRGIAYDSRKPERDLEDIEAETQTVETGETRRTAPPTKQQEAKVEVEAEVEATFSNESASGPTSYI